MNWCTKIERKLFCEYIRSRKISCYFYFLKFLPLHFFFSEWFIICIALLGTRRYECGDINFIITRTWFEFHQIALWLFRRFHSIYLIDLPLQFTYISAIIGLFRELLLAIPSLEFQHSLRRGWCFRSSGMFSVVICALLGHYAAQSGNSLPTFRENLSTPS